MKRLLVLRHAKTEYDAATGRDFDRALTERGRRDAQAVGRAMRERGLVPDAIVASPAKRVVETLAALAEGSEPLEPAYDPRVYNAAPETLLEVIREADDDAQTVLLVGHNPGLPLLLLDLTAGDDHGFRASVADGFATATLAAVALEVRNWAEIGPDSGVITSLITPRELGSS